MELIAKISKGSNMDQIYIPKNRTGLPIGQYVIIAPLEKELAKKQKFKPFFYNVSGLEPLKLEIIESIFNWLVGIIFTVSLIMLFFAAFLYMTAGASEAALGKAKTVLMYAIIGLAIAILVYSFKPFLESFFGGSF